MRDKDTQKKKQMEKELGEIKVVLRAGRNYIDILRKVGGDRGAIKKKRTF